MKSPDRFNLARSNQKSEQLIDFLIAAVLTAGIAALLFDFRRYEIVFWLTGLLALALVSLVALLSRRWWLAPLLLAGAGLIGAWMVWRLGSETEVLQYWQQNVSWFRGFFQFNQPAPDQQFLLSAGLMLPVAVLVYWLVCTLDSLWIYLSVTVTFLVLVLVGYPDAIAYFLVVLAGFFLQVPRFVAREIHRQRPQDQGLPRGSMQWLAVPVVIVSLMLANWLVPEQTLSWRLTPLANWVQDWQDLWQKTSNQGRSWAPFNLAYYGYANTGDQLGGPVSQNQEMVLRVTADRQLLLKGCVRTIYTGHSWQRTSQPYYRFESPLWRSQRRQIFADPLPSGIAGQRFSQNWQRSITLSVTQYQRLTMLFNAGTVQDIHVPDRLEFAPYFTLDGNLFTFAAQPSEFQYIIETSLLDRRQWGFNQAALAAEHELAAAAGDDPRWHAAQSVNLQLPAELPTIVSATASAITQGAASPYAKALALEQYLKNFGTYTLQPAKPQPKVDFVTQFLATQEGHCVYYATTMTVMARTLGIPARYVEGFVLDDGDQAGEYRATGKTAHAWAELYFQGLGWLTFDATPASPVLGAALPEEPEPTPTLPAAEPDTGTKTPGTTGPSATRILLIVLILFLLPILAGRILYQLAIRRHWRTFDSDRIRQRFPEPGRCLDYYYQDVLQQLACFGLEPEAGETLQQFAKRAESHLQVPNLTLPAVLWPVSRLRYGTIQPEPGDLDRIAAWRTAIENRLQASLQPVPYFFKRVLNWRN